MNGSFYYSLIGHFLAICLLFISMPSFEKEQTVLESVPILVDLKNIEIADKTNLPPKVKTVEKKQAQAVEAKPVPPKPVASQSAPEPEPVKPVQKTEPTPDAAAVEVPVEKAKPIPKPKPKVKPVPKPKAVPKSVPRSKPSKASDDGLDSLLASVEKMSKNSPAPKKTASSKQDVSDLVSGVLNGIEGGTTRSLGGKLTISQIDFIAASVRKHWNLDAGIDGVQDMVVEIRVKLTQAGRVYDVEFLNKNRYNNDSSFRSVAESARRAIYICDKLGEESPFRMLAVKYPGSYSDWKNLQLRFNPLDGAVS